MQHSIERKKTNHENRMQTHTMKTKLTATNLHDSVAKTKLENAATHWFVTQLKKKAEQGQNSVEEQRKSKQNRLETRPGNKLGWWLGESDSENMYSA